MELLTTNGHESSRMWYAMELFYHGKHGSDGRLGTMKLEGVR